MSGIFETGHRILFMKVGTHANETLSDIIARKRIEIAEAGFSMWGYGGNTCNPKTMVQPFVRQTEVGPVLLCMQPMESRHFAEPIRAEKYSVDGFEWESIPEPINVLGSRYALCIDSLEQVDEELSLSDTFVAVGTSKGKPGNDYVRGHVDKACLEVGSSGTASSTAIRIELVARIIEPYAVYLKN